MKIRPIKPFLFKGVVDGKQFPRGTVVGKQNVIETSDIHGKELIARRIGAAVTEPAPEKAAGAAVPSSTSAASGEAKDRGAALTPTPGAAKGKARSPSR